MRTLRLEDLPHYTYEDYKLWDGRWEIINGIAFAMTPSPIYNHQNISSEISYQLKNLLKGCKKCKSVLAVDWIIANDTVVCPDNAVVCDKIISEYLDFPPIIIFEVLSPSTKKTDRNNKYNLFQEQGVKYYILVEPKGRFAEVYMLENGIYRLQGEFSDEKYEFQLEDCIIKFNFADIFDKF